MMSLVCIFSNRIENGSPKCLHCQNDNHFEKVMHAILFNPKGIAKQASIPKGSQGMQGFTGKKFLGDLRKSHRNVDQR